jgi:thioredoxin 1
MVEMIDVEGFKKFVFNYDSSDEFAYAGETPLIVNFTASWCGPCQMFAPVLDSVAESFAGKLRVFKIDIDANPELPALFGVRSVPTTLFISKGEQPALASGAMPEDSMRAAIKDLFQMD